MAAGRLGFGVWVLGFGICAGTSCAKARAQTVPDGPPLAVPAPPERVIVPPEEPQVATAPPVVEQPPVVKLPPPPRATTRPTPAPQTPAAQPPPAPTVPAAETPRLTPPTAADLAEEKRIIAILQRAARDIGRVTVARLTADGRAQYEQSKSLSEQAGQAIRDRNWVYAETLADKAATLAAELVGR